MFANPLFRGFFLGGFECSTHRRLDGRRLDMVAATGHDRFAAEDYARLAEQGIRAARDGIRWHLIEPEPGRFDFGSVRPILRAAQASGIEVIWDILHYGWPDDLDIFAPEFVTRFARLAHEFARFLADEAPEINRPWVVPVNEISFLAWKGGEIAEINPYTRERGFELKRQLVRASLAAIEAFREVIPEARVAAVDPIFHAVAHPDRPHEAEAAEAYRLSQYQGWDMLTGRLCPDLGGYPGAVDAVGVNFYPWNQWYHNGEHEDGTTIELGHPHYRPLRAILGDVATRYGRPLFVAETGTEGDARAPWLRYVGDEVRAAVTAGIHVRGLCLYPIVDFPGWDNDRHCHNGLWDYPDPTGARPIHPPYAAELRRQRGLLGVESGGWGEETGQTDQEVSSAEGPVLPASAR